jgi:hypothetical protein
LALSSVPSFASAPDGAIKDLAFETSFFMLHSAYRNVSNHNREMAPDGAWGPVNRAWDASHSGKWYIEEQRYASDLIVGGIARSNTDAIDRGLLALKWGFAQQKSDGGFDCPDTFHSTSFFVEAAARSLLLLEASDYAARYRQTITGMKPKVLAAARWMMIPQIETRGKKGNGPYTHRRYLVAAALGETGILTHDSVLIKHSEEYARDGIALQSEAGYNPERGGWDSSYNAVGLLFACHYYVLVADEGLKPALYKMLDKGMRWEADRVNDEGGVQTEGNTRVGGAITEKGRSGKEKTVAVGQVYRAFYYWSVISGDGSYDKLARKVAQKANQWHEPK